MRRSLSIVLLQLRLQLSSRAVRLTMFGLPLLFTLLWGGVLSGNGGSSKAVLAIVDADHTLASRAVVQELAANGTFSVVHSTELDMRKLFVDKRISAGLTIPRGFQSGIVHEAHPAVDLEVPPGGNVDAVVKPLVSQVVSRVGRGLRAAAIAARTSAGTGDADPAALPAAYSAFNAAQANWAVHTRVEKAFVSGKRASETTVGELSLGFILMFMMLMVFQMTGAILREREHGTWGRLLSTPAKRVEITAGYVGSFMATGLLQFVILVDATSAIFHVRWGAMGPLMVVAACFTAAVSGMGLLLAGLVRTPEQQGSIGTIFVTVTSMLGGAFWSLDFVSPAMRKLAYFTPQAWAMEAFREVMLRGGGVEQALVPLGILLAFAAVFLTAGVSRIRYE